MRQALKVASSYLKRVSAKYDIDEVKKFIKQTHEIEGEDVDPEVVDGWVDFAMGDASRPPKDKHKGVEGHLHLLTSGSLPSSLEDVMKMYKTIGEAGVLRGGGQEVHPKGKEGVYVHSDKIGDELIKWIKKGKMGTIKSHVEFEKIHPGNDGNGRVGRLILLMGGYPIKDLNNLIAKKSNYLKIF